jgi:hypothetical protein
MYPFFTFRILLRPLVDFWTRSKQLDISFFLKKILSKNSLISSLINSVIVIFLYSANPSVTYNLYSSYDWVSGRKCCRYASESITAACDWAYKGVDQDSTLQGTKNAAIV